MTKSGSTTSMIDRLEKAGDLRCIRDVQDRRQALVEIIWEEPLHRLSPPAALRQARLLHPDRVNFARI